VQFTKRLREPIIRGEITQSVRIWLSPRVRVGGIYPMGPGHITVTALKEITLSQVTPELARRTGFAGVVDLLKTARHGRGQKVYLVKFRYGRGGEA
jgi:hypothetical protein